jgi:rhamnosyltransferase subunit B
VMMAGGEWLMGMPRWVRRGIYAGMHWQVDRKLRGAVNAMRREAGVKGEDVRCVFRSWWNSPDGVVCLFPEWYARKAGDWPRQAVTTRFPLYDEGEEREVDGELERFLEGGERPVVITPGSANVQAERFLREAVEGVAGMGRRAIVVTRTAEHLPRTIPAGVKWFEYVPFGRIFSRAAAVVHHGGIGTTAQCFAAGVPQLIMPMAHDQPDNAWRVRGLGCGEYLYPKRFVAGEIGRVLGRLMESESVREDCARVKGLMRGQMTGAALAEVIEGMARRDF